MPRKTEIEKVLDSIGIAARDENGNIRSPEELTNDVMELLDSCDKENAGRLLFMIALAKHMDDDDLP